MSEAYASNAVLFRNDDWTVSGEGLEHRATGYFIERASLGARRAEGLWDWPLQMAEKRWCRPSLFREAFLVALERFAVARDAALGRSFALGFGFRADHGPASESFVMLADLLRRGDAGRTAPAVRRPARISANA